MSYGRSEDGGNTWQLFTNPTPGITNAVTTTIDEKYQNLPKQISLQQNYPNPFNPKTTIKYNLPATADVEIRVYNYLGQTITTLVSARQTAGSYKVEWDASAFSSGVYFYRLTTKTGFISTKKLILLK